MTAGGNADRERLAQGSASQRAGVNETTGRTVLVLYLAHLMVPLLLLADALSTWREWWPNESGLAELGVGMIWLVLGVSCVAIRRLHRLLARRLPRFLLLIYTIYFCFGAGELLARRMESLSRPSKSGHLSTGWLVVVYGRSILLSRRFGNETIYQQ